MANIPEGRMVELPGFPYGIDNLSQETGVKANALREAVNVDLDEEGRPRRRRGYERALTGNFHSLTEAFGYLFVVKDGQLLAYDEGMNTTVLASGFAEEQHLAYAQLGERLWFTTPNRTAMITAALAVLPIWPECPPQPQFSTQADIGGLRAGAYQVVLTARDGLGRESGATIAVLVQVPDNGAILIDNLVALPPRQNYRIYMTRADEDELYFARDVPIGMTSMMIGVTPLTKHLDDGQQWLRPMPAGQAICYSAGRLWVARGQYLYYSEPLRYGAMGLDNYIRMAPDITMLAPAGEAENAGMYVGVGKRTLYLSGPAPQTMQMIVARPAGVVMGTYRKVHTSLFLSSMPDLPPTTAALWLSSDGVLCLGLPGGQVKPITQTRMKMTEDANRGALMLRNEDGLNQVTASLEGGVHPRAAASDQLTGTIYRGGIAVD